MNVGLFSQETYRWQNQIHNMGKTSISNPLVKLWVNTLPSLNKVMMKDVVIKVK